MSDQQISEDGRNAFFDDCRTEAVQAIYSYWAVFREPVGIERAAQLAIDRIRKKGLDWHWRMVPKVLTMRRRIEEGAKADRYAPDNPPLRCIGMRRYQGVLESQYQPCEAT